MRTLLKIVTGLRASREKIAEGIPPDAEPQGAQHAPLVEGVLGESGPSRIPGVVHL